ncbi:3-hydroxyacyl-CoA dehydrogenase NAD-binding domain-containing protein [Paenibacillus sp. LHD-117]|uniref:3-hydroxyacyl-CoA dehydrogenase/enoyl-CoA hydratase family protein n=1 Tax=Paenibacillus sp. LHD-117 TaxID=3071412 RepID=UPI0027E097F6|nr:3-hydroxyacyl-CoA dehydrogenase NAD-binding domain-containing protein [Paenibacillus sp. LHD-117]MDQ6421312.1 3-hydroxyacyl-CoA dehydrogenase NAD-binding domain-containing protein [Paenibacillus sp. LHD-117]
MSIRTTQVKSAASVRSAAVIGSGVMGAGIAAHLANAGMRVVLLDVVPRTLTEEEERKGLTLNDPKVRNRLAAGAIANMARSQPAPLYDSASASRIRPGNLTDDIALLGDTDWIVEAVVERFDVKREVLAAIESARRPGTLVTTNTSGLSVAAMAEGRSKEFREHFAATHFFNPPRYMKLVEIVPTADTGAEVTELLAELCVKRLGKGVVIARDTPNFIANRIGTYGMLVTLEDTIRYGLTVEEADALTGPAMGRPKTATFRMLDLVGLDTLLHVVDNVRERSEDDAERAIFARPRLLEELVAAGRLGEKSGSGFYRKRKDPDGRSRIESLRLGTLEYGPQVRISSPVIDAAKAAKGAAAKAKALLAANPKDCYAQFAWSTVKRTLLYAAAQVGVIAETVVDIDRAMKWGFNWELGPFELWDAIGVEKSVARMKEEGESIPDWVEKRLAEGHSSFYQAAELKRFYAVPGGFAEENQEADVISLSALKGAGRTVLGTQGASLIDIGDDVVCLEFHSQNNAIGGEILSAIRQSVAEVSRNWRGLVLANEGRNFCVGANLMLLLMEAQAGEWDEVEDIIRFFQDSMLRLKRLDRPVVAAPHRMTLGGGVEACLPADVILLSPETYFGLVETGVGLIPAGGGCKEAAIMAAERAGLSAAGVRSGVTPGDLQPHLNALFETIAMAKTSTSGHDAAKLGLLRPQDRAIVRQDARIAEAKRLVLELDRAGYSAPVEERVAVAGREGKAVLAMGVQAMRLGGHISKHDALIAGKLAHVLAGGDVRQGAMVSEKYLLDLECEAFLSLCGESKTQERMSHMLSKGKPLRN